jgi:hypothetical protein
VSTTCGYPLERRSNPGILDVVTQQQDPGDRVALNEALFRQVNERVRDVSQAFATLDPTPVEFVCECGLQECTEPISLRLHEYEAVRAVPTHFFVLPAHVIPEVERVVVDHGSYVVVDKLPGEQEIARETDARS